MSHEQPTPDDLAVLAALAALAPLAVLTPITAVEHEPHADSAAELAGPADRVARDEKETLTRLYHEVFGLVPWTLPPMTPRPEVKRRLMAAIALSEPGSPAGSPPLNPSQAAEPLPFPQPVAVAAPPPGASAKPGRAWMALAAALILALVATCAWLYRGVLEQGSTIARLSSQRSAAQRQVAEMQSRLERLTGDVKNLRDNFSVVTSPAVEVFPLRPASPGAPQVASATGVLFVAADHQHWYMSLRGLRPAGAGKVYQLWFVGDRGPVSGGIFGAESGAPWELGSEHMPAGTREIRITLENGSGAAAPSGPELLRNGNAFRVL